MLAQYISLLRVGSIRFSVYYWLSFLLGLTAVGQLTWPRAIGGVALWAGYCVCTEWLNRLADRTEDAVNRPERTALCEQVGWSRLRRTTAVGWSLLGAGGVTWWILTPNWPTAVVLGFAGLVSYHYSYGVRLKARPVLGQVALTMPLVVPFLVGVATVGWSPAFLGSAVLGCLVLMTFSLGLVGIKDITDTAGDRLIGYRSLWVRLARSGHLPRAAGATAPMLVVTVLAVSGALPLRCLLLWPLVVLSWKVMAAAGVAQGPVESYAAREVMHGYMALVLACALVVLGFSLPTTLLGLAGVLLWTLASRFLHWGPTVDAAILRTWGHVVAKSRRA